MDYLARRLAGKTCEMCGAPAEVAPAFNGRRHGFLCAVCRISGKVCSILHRVPVAVHDADSREADVRDAELAAWSDLQSVLLTRRRGGGTREGVEATALSVSRRIGEIFKWGGLGSGFRPVVEPDTAFWWHRAGPRGRITFGHRPARVFSAVREIRELGREARARADRWREAQLGLDRISDDPEFVRKFLAGDGAEEAAR